MPPYPAASWVRLGELLGRRRVELDPRYRNRTLFSEERGLNWRLLFDVEHAKRTNYMTDTIVALEAAYELAPGAIGRALEGAGLEPATGVTVHLPPAVVRTRKLPVLDTDDEDDLQPYVLGVRRAVLAAAGLQSGPGREVLDLPEVLASLPGALIFTAEHEVRIWDSDLLSAHEKERLIGLLRRLAAEAEVPSQRNAI